MNSFTQIVSAYITSESLLSKDSKYVVALSGGADSVALLLTLKRLGYVIDAAHCNFHLRGEESQRDEEFCISLCKRENIRLHRSHFDTKAYAELHKISIEMAARELRYHYFNQLIHDIGAQGVCVAHHRDDSVETVLINLIRGTGIHGLCGIAARNGNVLRPLLCVSRLDILEYLKQLHQEFVVDSSNLIDDVLRNKIRLDILPVMQNINPSVYTNIAKTAQYVREAVKMLDDLLKDKIVWQNKGSYKSFDIINIHTEYELWYLLKGYGFTSTQVEQAYHSLKSTSGKRWISKEYQLLIDRGRLLLDRNIPNQRSLHSKKLVIPECGTYIYTEYLSFKISLITVDKEFELSRKPDCVCLDAAIVTFPLTIRKTATGDRFVPLGMNGSKLISDFMTDKKHSLFEKQRQLVVEDASERVVWLVNERPDNRFRVTHSTTSVLKIEMLS